MVTNQAFLFLIFILNGIIIGLLFDFFRILRISFKTKNYITYIEDIIFWILTGLIVLYSIFTFNNGEIRFFIFIGLFLGIILYISLLSNSIIKSSVFIIEKVRNIFKKIRNIIKVPLNFIKKILRKTLLKPISFIIINIRKKFKFKIRQKNIKVLK